MHGKKFDWRYLFMRNMVYRIFAFLCVFCALEVSAQKTEETEDSNIAVTNSFWDNWYGQIGIDMNLMFPYGYDMTKVFPNGKSFGINVAVGKWFTPELGGKFKITWGNGILNNNHNQWLRPFGVPGENHRNGGYLTFIGDIPFNLTNLLGNYNENRKWNLLFSPRAGGWIDVGSGDGAPVLGIGIINTYSISDRYRLFADVGYHFIASLNSSHSSGTGHGSNGFAEINIGVEMDLSTKNKFHKTKTKAVNDTKSVELNHFWDNWFAQIGIGMSLINPYGTNFKNVFPNGSTYGINLGFGKWFSPEVGLRGGLNWQNGLIINNHASYLEPREGSAGDPDKHGFMSLYADMFFNLHNIIGGYEVDRKWNAIIYPRMGIAKCFSSEFEECPVIGFGTEQTYAINRNLKLFADVSYQVTTGGFLDSKFQTGVGCNSNGWFDINVGVQYDLGLNTWYKPGTTESRNYGYTEGHNWSRFLVNTGASVVVAFGAKTALKAMIKEERPDHSDNKSFPSGHAAMAFAAARSIDKEFRKDCIWIPIAGYAAATAVGIERIANKHHHWYDVVAGAAVGYGAAELTWWLSDLCFGKGSNIAVGSSGNTVDVTYNF